MRVQTALAIALALVLWEGLTLFPQINPPPPEPTELGAVVDDGSPF